MSCMTRTTTATLALLVATGMTPLRAAAAGPQAEIQIGLCAPIQGIVRALDLRPHGAAITVWQFDDSALTLFGRGLRLRLRVAADGRSVLTLKVAGQDCAHLDSALAPRPGEGKCEYDVYGERTSGALSLDLRLGEKSTSDLLAGRVPLAEMLSPAQLRYLRTVAGFWPLPSGIRALGPMQVQTYRTKHPRYDIDISLLPGGERYAEISSKAPLVDATRVRRAMEADLSRAGIDMCADQSSQAENKLRKLLH
jgi:hypothetical protein